MVTKHSPLSFGSVWMVPFRFMLRTITVSPILKSDALCCFAGFATVFGNDIFSVISSSFSRVLRRSFSMSAVDAWDANFRMRLMDSSA